MPMYNILPRELPTGSRFGSQIPQLPNSSPFGQNTGGAYGKNNQRTIPGHQNHINPYMPYGNQNPMDATMARLQPLMPNLNTNRGMSRQDYQNKFVGAGGNWARLMRNNPDVISQNMEASGRSAMQPYLWGNEGNILDQYKQIGQEGMYGKEGMNDIMQAYRGGMTNALGAYSGAIDKGRQGLQRGIMRGGGSQSQPGMMTRRLDNAFSGAELGKAQLGADMAGQLGNIEGALTQENLGSKMMGLQGQQGFYDTVTNRQMGSNAQELNRVNSAPARAMQSVPLAGLQQSYGLQNMDVGQQYQTDAQNRQYLQALNSMWENQQVQKEFEAWMFNNGLGEYFSKRQSKIPGIIGGGISALGDLLPFFNKDDDDSTEKSNRWR